MPRRKRGGYMMPEYLGLLGNGVVRRKRRAPRRRMAGAGFFSNLLNAVKPALSAAHSAIKDNKVLSKNLPGFAGKLAASYGYGKPKRRRAPRRRRVVGAGFFGDLWSGVKKAIGAAHDVVKESKVLSNSLPGFAGKLAGSFGYGRKRRRGGMAMSMRRRHIGGRVSNLLF